MKQRFWMQLPLLRGCNPAEGGFGDLVSGIVSWVQSLRPSMLPLCSGWPKRLDIRGGMGDGQFLRKEARSTES